MGLIPDSQVAGQHHLHNRALASIERGEESQDTEYKESAPWADLKHKIAKTAMAMAKPCTERATHAELRELIDLAAEKRAQSILASARRVGLVPVDTASDQFDRELGGL